jgi:hypothetical protein
VWLSHRQPLSSAVFDVTNLSASGHACQTRPRVGSASGASAPLAACTAVVVASATSLSASADTPCASGLRTRGLSSSEESALASADASKGGETANRLWRQSFGSGAASAAPPCHLAMRNAAVPLAGRSRGLLAVRTGPRGLFGVCMVLHKSDPFEELAESGPLGEPATRVRFGGRVARFGGSADFFGIRPPMEFLRGPRWSPKSRAAFGRHEMRDDPSPAVSVRSRKDSKAHGSIGLSPVATLARCNGLGDGTKP